MTIMYALDEACGLDCGLCNGTAAHAVDAVISGAVSGAAAPFLAAQILVRGVEGRRVVAEMRATRNQFRADDDARHNQTTLEESQVV